MKTEQWWEQVRRAIGHWWSNPFAGLDLSPKAILDFLISPEPITLLALVLVLVVRQRSSWFGRRPVRRGFGIWGLGAWWRRRRLNVSLSDARHFRVTLSRVMSSADARETTAIDASRALFGTKASAGQLDRQRLGYVIMCLRRSLAPTRQDLIVRYVVEREWSANRDFLTALLGYLEPFEGLLSVAPKDVAGARFADTVSAVSGSLVLADLTGSAAGCADRMLVWHTGHWDGRIPDKSRPWWIELVLDRRVGYRQNPLGPLYLRFRESPSHAAALGSYNGRVPTLRATEIMQHPGSDGATIVLWIGESSYFSTEPSQEGVSRDETRDGVSRSQCKKLPESIDPAWRWRWRPSVIEGIRVSGATLDQSSRADAARPPLLNAKMGLIVETGDHTYLSLLQRSSAPSNGGDVVGPTSGGVIELAVPHDDRDGDEFGGLDVLRGIRREVHEETGLAPDDYSLAVYAIYASNTRPRPRTEKKRANGESTGTVLALGRTQLSPDEVDARRYAGSPSRGLYESEGLVHVPMGGSASTFVTALFEESYCRTHRAWLGRADALDLPPARCAKDSERCERLVLADEMEQAALVVALYASAVVFGPAATTRAVAGSAPASVWWARPWPAADVGYRSRVAFDPANLLADPSSSPWARSLRQEWKHDICSS